ncbi:C2H2 type zinc-finger-domain-containing protein [Radiomyces spectabilis]|uniref:C2H2 type zinc-finger-domain-containing protein n=1 Tax=Radiomyces spectabilis TaxID=64574 RepID=UPI00221F5DFB|nr:C2H2 type zinc-finger-domain-containing protein [Radiomyces spectabilis]KAI8393587.1 C2H2 type zinc-finger-domain-containing protein [Radiomyces spectabilis]
MSLAPAILTQQSEPQSPRNAMFTCLACHVAFPTSDRQRQHYRTDWHKYNLKRKIANLTPVTAEQFAQKVLAQQAKGREEAERAGLVYECVVCRKTYLSENAFTNHIYSRKHKEMEAKGGSRVDALINQHKREVRMFSSEGESDAESHGASVSEEGTPRDPLAYCLFCSQVNTDFEMNLDHMASVHGFFLPDIEYLEDTRGLIAYLVEKVQDGICIYCNGRGREWKSVEAVRSHMLDKGHCKMAYDESEDPDALLRFYDFGPIDLDDESDTAFNVKDAELILNNGARLGHRNDLRYFKQRLRKNVCTMIGSGRGIIIYGGLT